MDQRQLRELESRCIEENPPWCMAACPLHVDARSLCNRVAAGDWSGAWKVLLRTMPLPGILGRICDAPCRERCKRGEAGEAIAINELERACVSHAPPARPKSVMPARPEQTSVIGSGMSGLTAAWDLARKGFKVTLFEPGPVLAAELRERLAEQVPADVFDSELAMLTRAGVRVELNAAIYEDGFLESCRSDSAAMFLSLDALEPESWPLLQGAVASPAQTTGREGMFACGLEHGGSPVWLAAQGRWGASSMDRFLQGVSPSAGREKDGPYETRLFTSLEGIDPLPMVPLSPEGYDETAAAQEAGRCLQCHCLECVKVCPYLESFGAYPKKYAREIYNNQSLVMGARQANKLIDSCSLCGLCEAVCPESFPMQALCLATRREMVAKGKMPPSAHEFALLDMEFSLSEHFRLARHQPGHQASAQVLFPGCQLAASSPGQLRRVYEHLCANLPGGVGLMLACCGAPAHWAGQEARGNEVIETWLRDWRGLGSPPVIMACCSCRDIFRTYLSEVEQAFLWDALRDTNIRMEQAPDEPLALHDPCTTRHDAQAQATIRTVLAQAGVEVEELALGRELTECCGYGGLMANANPELAKEVITRRGGQSPRDYLAYCAVCRDRLAAVGKRALHALDLYFPEPGEPDPAARPNPGWSARRENRARLKDELLRELYKEEPPAMEAFRQIKLSMAPEVADLLERRRILIEDVQQVIHHAENGGDKLTHPEAGHFLASFRPYKATFWVEYSPAPDGYEVHNAYSHRMTVKTGARP
ncbi:MAG: 4Fe-4S dicluster domain-containing protein [Deltaproteobacteria bacterium]|nr:4Fe-4S dicluster domain-containing protein [Deltaproteobacteria bacterium]